jgi:hypothetical protein
MYTTLRVSLSQLQTTKKEGQPHRQSNLLPEPESGGKKGYIQSRQQDRRPTSIGLLLRHQARKKEQGRETSRSLETAGLERTTVPKQPTRQGDRQSVQTVSSPNSQNGSHRLAPRISYAISS